VVTDITDIIKRLQTIRDHLRTGALGQREAWEGWLAEAGDEIKQLTGSKAALQTEIERLRDLDTASTKLCHSLDTEVERLKKILDGAERREAEYLAIIEKRTAERDVWKIACDAQAEKVTQLQAERHTTKMMLHDILDKHIPKKPVE
jgi:chromosome segregation ATPase